MLQSISATPSPYARKVRIALAEKGIPFELITEVPWDSTTQTPAHNPLEKLPVLIVPAADSPTNQPTSVYESHFIFEWLETHYPPPQYTRLFPSSPAAALAAKQIQVVCDGICDALVLRLFELQREHPSDAWLARQMRKVEGGMKWVAEKVEERSGGGDGVVEGEFGVADIAIGCVAGYLDVRFAEFGYREKYPVLGRYMDGLMERESFKGTVPRGQTISDKVV